MHMYYQCVRLQVENDTCVKFTPSQYKSIYYLRLQHPLIRNSSTNELDALCLLQMRTRNWQNTVVD